MFLVIFLRNLQLTLLEMQHVLPNLSCSITHFWTTSLGPSLKIKTKTTNCFLTWLRVCLQYCSSILQGQKKKSVVWLSGTSTFSCSWASYFLFSLTQWARAQASHMPTKSSKEHIKTCPPGKQNLSQSYLSKGQAWIQFVFFEVN